MSNVTGLVVNLPEFHDGEDFMVLDIEERNINEGGNTLRGLQNAVNGLVDCFDVKHPETGAQVTVWFNDEGKVNGMESNDFANTLAAIGGWPGLDYGDWIAGPVVFTGYEPSTGETTSVPREWVELVDATFDTASLFMALLTGTEVRKTA